MEILWYYLKYTAVIMHPHGTYQNTTVLTSDIMCILYEVECVLTDRIITIYNLRLCHCKMYKTTEQYFLFTHHVVHLAW